MRDKGQIIAQLTRLVLDLLKIGQDKFQEVTNLLCEIEQLPKDEIPIIVHTNVHSIVEGRLCPSCKVEPRKLAKSGKLNTYCGKCNSMKTKQYRNKAINI